MKDIKVAFKVLRDVIYENNLGDIANKKLTEELKEIKEIKELEKKKLKEKLKEKKYRNR